MVLNFSPKANAKNAEGMKSRRPPSLLRFLMDHAATIFATDASTPAQNVIDVEQRQGIRGGWRGPTRTSGVHRGRPRYGRKLNGVI